MPWTTCCPTAHATYKPDGPNMQETETIEEYILSHIDPESGYLKRLYRDTHVKLLRPRMASGHLQGRLLKMLVCMLKVAADSYEIYSRKGIEPSVYTATMKCFSRFLKETYERTGRYEFDRYWWTARQAGCHEFRIGALEYERNYQ